METSEHYQKIINLGKTISAEFDESSRDTFTSKWMANYIAELISKVESTEGAAERAVLEKECAEIIIKLWQHRASFRNNAQPLSRLSDAVSILATLVEEKKIELWHWQERERDDTDWGEFIRQVKAGFDHILNLSLAVNLNEELLAKESEWLEHIELLDKDEAEAIKLFDSLANNHQRLKIFFLPDNGRDAQGDEAQPARIDIAFNKLKEELQSLLQKLESLERRIKGVPNPAKVTEESDEFENDE